nr:unnamed protein product [Callosobruchus analis]
MALRNQFVYGLHSRCIQSRLLETRDLTLDRAVEISTSMEMSERDANQLHRKTNSVDAIVQKNKRRNPNQDNATSRPSVSKTVHNSQINTHKSFCYRCGDTRHFANKCNMTNVICNFCKRKGHLQRVCTKAKGASNTNEIEETDAIEEIFLVDKEEDFTTLRDKYYITIQVNSKYIKMEVDSGAPVSLINHNIYKKLFSNYEIQNTRLKLVSYCKTQLKVIGFIHVPVTHNNLHLRLNLYIVQGDRNPLLGREWIRTLHINLQDLDEVNKISSSDDPDLQDLLSKYKNILTPGIGKIKNIQAEIHLKEGTRPVFMKARPVPFALQPLVEEEIDNLVSQGVLEKVDMSEWATPIVPVVKSNGKVRLCGDFKVTLNPEILVDDHPLPTIDEIFAKMAGGVKFSKIDLSKAYLHLEVKQEHRHLLTLNTYKGLYRSTRLMFGIASAPAIWQRIMEQILQGIPGVVIFQDDINVTGPDKETHLYRLRLVLDQLQKHDLRVNLQKSQFFVNEIE